MIFSIIRGFLMVSGSIFWVLLVAGLVIEIRRRRWLRRNKREWPEPDFDEARARRVKLSALGGGETG
jgi:hypothetical protein